MKRSIWADDYLNLRKSLKKIRKEANQTQKELTITLDKPRTYVTKYELVDRNLDFLEVIKVCGACDIKPSAFIKRFIKTNKNTTS